MITIADVFTRTDNLVTGFVTGGYAAVAAWAMPAIYAGFTLVVIVMGFMYLRGGRFNLTDMAFRLMQAAIIVTFATNWGWFSTIVYNGLVGVNNELGAALMGAFGIPAAGPSALQNVVDQFVDGASGLMSRLVGFPPDWSALISIIILFIGLFLLIGYAVFLFVFSKVAFAITIVLAPVFIPFAFFQATREMFGSWVRTVAGFVVIPILATCVIAFALSVLSASFGEIATGNVNVYDVAITGLITVAFAMVMWQVPSIAGGMVGSVGVSGAGAMASMFMSPVANVVTGRHAINSAREALRQRVAAERWGEGTTRGRQRQLARMRAKAKESA